MRRWRLLDRRRRTPAVVVLMGLGVLTSPAVASAATVSLNGNVITYQAASGEANGPSLQRAFLGDDFVVGDSNGVVLTAGAGCELSFGTVFCPAAGVTRIRLLTGDLVDSVFVDSSVGVTVTTEINVGEGGAQTIQSVRSESPGTVLVTAGSGSDRIETFGGDDVIVAGGGDDNVTAGAGHDAVDLGPGADEARGGPGADEVQGGSGADVIYGDAGMDVIRGGADGDDLWGEQGADLIDGQDGDDDLHDDGMLTGVFGGDVLVGGAGKDTADYGSRGGTLPVNISLDGVANDGAATEADNVGPLGDIEVVEGTGNDDVLTGSPRADELHGGYGADSLDGRGGDDLLDGFAGNDRLVGGDGGDTLEGSADSDGLLGEGGDDMLRGGTGDDSLAGGAGADHHDGGLGNDVMLARDGLIDQIRCSLGHDSVDADPYDLFDDAPQCENVVGLPTAGDGVPGGGGTAEGGGPTAPAPALDVSLETEQRLGAVLVRGILARAAVPAPGRLSVTALINARTAHRLRIAAARRVVIGRAQASTTAARTVTARVKFTRKARRKLRRMRSVKLTLKFRFTPASGPTTTVTRRMTLRR